MCTRTWNGRSICRSQKRRLKTLLFRRISRFFLKKPHQILHKFRYLVFLVPVSRPFFFEGVKNYTFVWIAAIWTASFRAACTRKRPIRVHDHMARLYQVNIFVCVMCTGIQSSQTCTYTVRCIVCISVWSSAPILLDYAPYIGCDSGTYTPHQRPERFLALARLFILTTMSRREPKKVPVNYWYGALLVLSTHGVSEVRLG